MSQITLLVSVLMIITTLIPHVKGEAYETSVINKYNNVTSRVGREGTVRGCTILDLSRIHIILI